MKKSVIVLLSLLSFLTACEEEKKEKVVIEPGKISGIEECALDGMIVGNYPGPKAQIVYKADGKQVFFCETKELFYVYAEPGKEAQVAALFVQNTATTDWEKPVGSWIDAQKAYYVVGASIQGSMGPTFAPFADRESARPFIKKYGGEIKTFDEIIKMIGG
ncbi:MAG: nitrous oxide reductase accessory protein NosL [Deltaproteobacteria bacterium]|nr:nitrous oxide reductase accessory protein NosL [Deltaproteobacteria bacterium]